MTNITSPAINKDSDNGSSQLLSSFCYSVGSVLELVTTDSTAVSVVLDGKTVEFVELLIIGSVLLLTEV